jgi:hypothetical protein
MSAECAQKVVPGALETYGNAAELGQGSYRRQLLCRAVSSTGAMTGDVGDDGGLMACRTRVRESQGNATQRGNLGTVLTGSVAAAVRFLAKAISTATFPPSVEISTPGFDSVQKSKNHGSLR